MTAHQGLPRAALASLALLAAAAPARADLPAVSLGARAGYALTYLDGEAIEGSRHLPLQLDVMAHLPLGFRAGLYGSYAPCVSSSSLADGDKLRVGVQVHYRLPLPGVVHPWAGVGTGYVHTTDPGTTAVNTTADDGRPRTSTSSASRLGGTPDESGWEMFNLQAGVQVALLPRLELGPYIEYDLGARAERTSTPAQVVLPTGPVATTPSPGATTSDGSHLMRLSFGLRVEVTL